jgi:hypothetical protein
VRWSWAMAGTATHSVCLTAILRPISLPEVSLAGAREVLNDLADVDGRDFMTMYVCLSSCLAHCADLPRTSQSRLARHFSRLTPSSGYLLGYLLARFLPSICAIKPTVL